MTAEIKDSIFREYDIRGRFGPDLTTGVAETIARAYAAYLKEKTNRDGLTVTVGRDVRLSSGDLRDAFIKGLIESGVDSIDLGECPTPLQYFSLHTMKAHGGVMITGSHNPPEYNGFKISVGKETIHGAEIQDLKRVVKNLGAVKERRKGRTETADIISKYINYHIENFTGAKALKNLKKPIRLVIDAGNGTAGLVAPELLKKLGVEVIELFCEPDGHFPNHHPDPTVPENLKTLITEVKNHNADFGVGYDGDADRIGVVDEKGEIVWGDQLLTIFASDVLTAIPGATIVGEVKCSQTLYDEVKRLGGNAVMWKTGHSLIKAKMKELNAAVAGEMSGHIFFADRYFGFDDAIYSTIRLVEILVGKRLQKPGFAFSSLLSGLPRTYTTPEIRVECPDSEKFRVVEELKKAVKDSGEIKIKDTIDIDGLRIIVEGGWALVRASNTQPVLVFRYEAQNEELIRKLKAFMDKSLKKVWPGMR